MSALQQQKSFINTAATITTGNWQVDRSKRNARHISGLIVQLKNGRQGRFNAPALDIAGLGHLRGTMWSQKLADLVSEAIALLDG